MGWGRGAGRPGADTDTLVTMVTGVDMAVTMAAVTVDTPPTIDSCTTGSSKVRSYIY